MARANSIFAAAKLIRINGGRSCGNGRGESLRGFICKCLNGVNQGGFLGCVRRAQILRYLVDVTFKMHNKIVTRREMAQDLFESKFKLKFSL